MSKYCMDLEEDMNDKVSDLIYPYGVDWFVCPEDTIYHSTRYNLNNWFLEKVVHDSFGRPIPKPKPSKQPRLGDWDKCAVDYLTTYLNTASVQTALHAKSGTEWALCSDEIKYNETDINTPMESYYTYLVNGDYNLNIAIYSGDDDSVCGTLGTQSWLFNMGWTIEKSWSSWQYQGQTAGYHVKFRNALDFVTIHSA
eukprot:237472_1